MERYNFTISEDSPLDKEVAVDPEMIGKVYESLVNVSDEVDERGDAGIFYTPRTEIDLMCRLSLVDNLTNHVGKKYKDLIYEVVFAFEPDEKTLADKALAKANLWKEFNDSLGKITVLDPACGSGSFLVGILYILDDLQDRAAKQLKSNETPYDRKKRIIRESLYGVDVMAWACHIAELRLWLALIIDAEIPTADRHIRKEPLLPHFSFKIRCGDSLVQEVGGINLGHIQSSHDISPQLKKRLTKLKTEKFKFYNNDPSCQFRSTDEAMHEELQIFRDILGTRQHNIEQEIKNIQRAQETFIGKKYIQPDFEGFSKPKPHQAKLDLKSSDKQKEVKILQQDIERIKQARSALKDVKDVPFVWDIAFVENFGAEISGFDIIIGNPPYVRQENISDPMLTNEKVTASNKKIYKAKLARSIYQIFPRFFEYNASRDTAANKIDAKSDLYIYFYLHGLSLLNPNGSFCFITSNSWLDVGYGKRLQEFLLKHCHTKMVIDNQAKRSFASADVNTVIVLFSSPDMKKETRLEETARFVMFKEPFEHILSPVIFEEIEAAKKRKTTPEYRVNPILQKLLLEDGCKIHDDKDSKEESRKGRIKKPKQGPLIEVAKYIGNKWGGKYLRAPDIYWTILGKGKDKLVRLGDIAEVRRGFTSGSDGWFHVLPKSQKGKYTIIASGDGSEHKVEDRFLYPIVRSLKECKKYRIRLEALQYRIMAVDISKEELNKYIVADYISYGEVTNYPSRSGGGIPSKRPTCAARGDEWYRFNTSSAPEIKGFMFKLRRDKHFVATNQIGAIGDDALYEIHTEENCVVPLLNSTMIAFLLENIGRVPGGGSGPLAIMVFEAKELPILNPYILTNSQRKRLLSAFDKMINLDIKSIFEELGFKLCKNRSCNNIEHPYGFINSKKLILNDILPERRDLDNIVFEVIGMTEKEQIEVYQSLVDMVKNRLVKARSL